MGIPNILESIAFYYINVLKGTNKCYYCWSLSDRKVNKILNNKFNSYVL